MIGEKAADDLADIGGGEAAIVDFDIFAITQRGNDAGIGGRPADAVLFERFDQRGFGVARRRLGEMLLGVQRGEHHDIALLHGRQYVIAVFIDVVVAPFLIDGDVAGFDQCRAVGTQHMARRAVLACEQFDGHGVEQRVRHLAGDRAFPDQRVELVLIGVEVALDFGRHHGGEGRAHGFVRFLRVFRLGLVDADLFGYRFLAIEPLDRGPDLGHGFSGQGDGIGTHVADETNAALADIHAFIKLLCNAHGALGGKAELARSFLLQRRGGKGRRGIATALLAIDLQHLEPGRLAGCGPQRGLGRARCGFIAEAELLYPGAGEFHQLEGETLAAVLARGVDGPVFLRYERGNFIFALADHAQRRALHASGRQAAAHFLP